MQYKHIKSALTGALITALLLTGCKGDNIVDSHAGQIQVLYGSDGLVWVDEQKNVPVSDFSPEDFTSDGQYMRYTGADYTAAYGIDVSEHQNNIDWAQVADSGVEFVMIRSGYRGSTEGQLYIDSYFRENIEGALANGLAVGVYFFSQATTEAEAVAEADYVIAQLKEYSDRITMPVVYDWEQTGMDDARTVELPAEQITACAEKFCSTIAQAGYTPGVYFNRHMGYYFFDFTNLSQYVLWFAGEGDYPDFHYRHNMWQYTFKGEIPGIDGEVDLDLYLTPAEE